MNITQEAFGAFKQSVRESQINPIFRNCPVVAILAGPAVVIEAIVRTAEEKSQIPMDWGYVGGRGVVRANGDIKKARSALFFAMPTSDLSEIDI